ncbi:LysR substrate-binding domain-containing protein [Kiloniella antarctica]|uniref:LysR substrate-binding domain-containing protein n=1 Tax=Kiloniella antarctica TaxID=1550907 RepID=A0ABW5BHW9_9PROT
MPRYLPPLNAVRAFEAAGRHESFSRAAEELNVTHAAISRHVRGLEKQLGAQLFRKVARGVALTENGKAYLVKITPALDLVSEASEALRGQQTGTILISCEPTFAMKWLMPRLGEFQEISPDVDVSLVASSELADLKNHQCDLAIRYYSQVPVGISCDLISTSPVFPYGIPTFMEAKLPEDLLQYKLLHEDKGQSWTSWFAKAGHENFQMPQKSSPLSSLLAIEGALAGQGVVLASAELVAKDVENGRLKRLSNVSLDYGRYYLVFLNEVVRKKHVAAFRQWIINSTTEFREN